MNPYIKITRYPYEEPYHVNLRVEAAYGGQAVNIEYYANASDLLEMGAALTEYPFGKTKEYIYEIGSEDVSDRFAYYIRLKVFLIRPTGLSGIEIRYNNNSDSPDKVKTEFTMQAEIAEINRLGDALTRFGGLDHTELEWDGSEAVLKQ